MGKPRCTNECAEDFKHLEKRNAELALAAVKQAKRGDFRWLIEAPGTRYLAVQRLSGSDNFEWTSDHNKALAFRSKEQADALMMAVRQMDREIEGLRNHGKLSWGTLFAFETTLGNAAAIEHSWM